MYKRSNENIHLDSMPSKLNNNLSLLFATEFSKAELFTVIHGKYVNIIFLKENSIQGLCKQWYTKKQQKYGIKREVKWLNLYDQSYLIILSNIGIQIYRKDNLQKPIFRHECLEHGDGQGYMQGICCVDERYICVGSSMGTIWIFRTDHQSGQFEFLKCHFAHNGSIVYLVSNGNYCISSGMDKRILVWKLRHEIIYKFRDLTIDSPKAAICTSIIFLYYTIICGYNTGDIRVFDLYDTKIHKRYVAHKIEISAMDFSHLKGLLLTASKDTFVKILIRYKYDLELKFEIQTYNGPLLGAQFFNRKGEEFGVVSLNSTKVATYVNNEDTNFKKNNYNLNISGIFELEQSDDEENEIK